MKNQCIAAAIASLLYLTAASAATPPAEKPIPRLSNGKPDFNGTWDNGGGIDFLKPTTLPDGSVCVSGCTQPTGTPAAPRVRPTPDMPKYKPEFQAKVADLKKRQVQFDPVLRCRSPGLPRIGPPDKIVQTLNEMVFLYDDVSGSFYRIVPTDGRPHRDDVDESYLGDAVGRWDGDTLVIDVNQFNGDSWLTDNGAFHTKNLRVTETLRRVGDTIEYQAIADDPAVLAEPWKIRPRLLKLTDVELVEPVPCVEQDLKHLVDDTHHENPR